MASRQRPIRAAAPTAGQLQDTHRTQEENDDIQPLDSCSEEEDNLEEIEEQTDSDSEPDVPQGRERRLQGNRSQYTGRNDFIWTKTPPQQRGRRGRQDIIRQAEGPAHTARNATEVDESFFLFFTDDMMNSVVLHTNAYAQLYTNDNEGWTAERWKPIDKNEFKAFVACLLFAGFSKSQHESLRELWSPDVGRPFLRAAMSLERFLLITKFLRFDDKSTRIQRRERDKMAPISELWDKFMQCCRINYNVGANCTVDEQLVGFRGRCPFRMYIPSKPDKYGIKIWWLCDSATGYAFNGQVYKGKVGNLPEVGLGKRVVEDLTQPLRNTGRNITTDNFFTSIPLAEQLFSQKLTLLGTLKVNKPEIPQEFQKNRARETHSSLFGFTEKLTLCSYVPKKGKSVICLSSMHHDAQLSDREDRKPKIIMDYNATKGAVDTLDQCVHGYSCSRATNRWPNKIFYNIVDIAAYNGYIVFTKNNPDWNSNLLFKRRIYLKDLCKQMAGPHMERRVQNTRLPASVRNLLAEQGYQNQELVPAAAAAKDDNNAERSRCYLCDVRNQVRVRCTVCKNFVCQKHSTKKIFCQNCD